MIVRDARLKDGAALARMRWAMSVEDGADCVPFGEFEADRIVHLADEDVPAEVGTAVRQRVVEWGRERELEGLFVSPSDRSVRYSERAGFTWSEQWMENLYDEV